MNVARHCAPLIALVLFSMASWGQEDRTPEEVVDQAANEIQSQIDMRLLIRCCSPILTWPMRAGW